VTELALAKYHFDGTLDTSFGAGGMIVATPRAMAGAFKLQLTPDGGFIVLGNATTHGDIMEAAGGEMLLKFTSAGKIDTTFGRNGVLKPEHYQSFAVDPQGRMMLCPAYGARRAGADPHQPAGP